MRHAARRAPTAVAWRGDSAEDQHRFVGLMIVSLFPALFWTGLVAAVAGALGHSPSPAALLTFGAAVAVFCAAAGQVLLSKN